MLQEAKDLQNSAVSKLVNVVGQKEKSEYTFKSPTGSGKTYMMADFMNRIICANLDVIFLVSTLSKSSLAEQNYKSFKALSENGTFSRLNPFLINSDSSGEGAMSRSKELEAIKSAFYKLLSKLKGESDGESRAENDPFEVVEQNFKAIYSDYKRERAEYMSRLEAEREESLKKKKAIRFPHDLKRKYNSYNSTSYNKPNWM